MEWVEKITATIQPWEGASLRVQRHIPRVTKVMAVVHGLPDSTDVILKRLQRQNPGLRTNLWRTYFRKEESNRVLLAFGVDEASLGALSRQKFVAYAGVAHVTSVTKKNPAANQETKRAGPSSATEPSSAATEGAQPSSQSTSTPAETYVPKESTDDEVKELLAQVRLSDANLGTRVISPTLKEELP